MRRSTGKTGFLMRSVLVGVCASFMYEMPKNANNISKTGNCQKEADDEQCADW